MYYFNPFDNFMFTIIPVLGVIIFVVVFIAFFVVAVKGVSRWNKNNQSPVLTVSAKVTAKRSQTSVHRGSGNTDMDMHHSSSSTSYYATFEVESGDRLELTLSSNDYAMLAEGDFGSLTFQGTRFKGFTRHRQ